MNEHKQTRAVRAAAAVAMAFGLLTIVSGGVALSGRVDMGAVAAPVLWFNFGAGFAYVAAGLSLWGGRPWGWRLSAAIALATLAVLAYFGAHVWQGGAYEMRTLGALVLRALVWIAIAAVALRAARAHQAPAASRAPLNDP